MFDIFLKEFMYDLQTKENLNLRFLLIHRFFKSNVCTIYG